MPFDGTNLDETTKTLIEARRILIDYGWCVGNLVQNDGRHCAMGAINAAMGHHVNAAGPAYGSEAEKRLLKVLPQKWLGQCIPSFNNAQDTVEPVIALFDRAIANSP